MRNTISISLLFFLINFSYAQCDSIKLSRFSVDAFSDTAIGFDVSYSGNIQYNYPSYKAINNLGDTLAISQVNTFILTNGYREKLTIVDGVQFPTNFNGKILVYSNFEDSLQCTIDVDENLCQFTDSCNLIAISMDNFGGAMVDGEFYFKVLDEQNNNLHSGSFVLNNTSQTSTDIVCLKAGKYTIEIDSSEYLGGQVFINTKTLPVEFYNISNQYFYKKTTFNLQVFPLCETESNSIENKNLKALNFYLNNGFLMANKQYHVNKIDIYSLNGQLVYSKTSPIFPITLNQLKPGVYLLKEFSNLNQSTHKIFIP